MSIRTRSARLQTGTQSLEQALHPDLLRRLDDMKADVTPQLARSPHAGDHMGIGEVPLKPWFSLPECTHTVYRPAWQAFVTMIQLHTPIMAPDLDPAHRIGLLSREKVTLSVEAIETLNYFIIQWYGAEVEVVTVSVKAPTHVDWKKEGVAHYEQPYRPVHGLKVIVTPTQQWVPAIEELEILKERESWGKSRGLDGLVAARRMAVRWGTPKRKSAAPGSGNHRLLKWMSGK